MRRPRRTAWARQTRGARALRTGKGEEEYEGGLAYPLLKQPFRDVMLAKELAQGAAWCF